MAIGNGKGDLWSNAGDDTPSGDIVNTGYITNGELDLTSGDNKVNKYFNTSTREIYYKAAPKYDYDFITTHNWTSTGTKTLSAYKGSFINVAASNSLYYRKVGDANWIETTDGTINITSTGEWEVGNNWEKDVSNNVLNHSYNGITDIDACTAIYMNEDALGTTVGNNFLYGVWLDCLFLSSLPTGFNLPQTLTSVGNYFLRATWVSCSNLTSLPTGFNLPQNLTSVGSSFLDSTWSDAGLTSLPTGFQIPQGITSAGSSFLFATWNDCSSLTSNAPNENLTFKYNTSSTFAGSCPITPDSITGATPSTPVNVAVKRS
jgi:hypothetical protein